MNYIPIHTSIYPSYDYMTAENSFLKQDVEYKNAVLCEQAETIKRLQEDVQNANAELDKTKAHCRVLETDKDRYKIDARRWAAMKQIILSQGGQRQVYEVTKTVDKELERNK